MDMSCPVCLKIGVSSKLEIIQITRKEALIMCENVKCYYPLLSGGKFIKLERQLKDIDNPVATLKALAECQRNSQKSGISEEDGVAVDNYIVGCSSKLLSSFQKSIDLNSEDIDFCHVDNCLLQLCRQLTKGATNYNYSLNFDTCDNEESRWTDYRCKSQPIDVLNNVCSTDKIQYTKNFYGCTYGKTIAKKRNFITESAIKAKTLKRNKTVATTSGQNPSCGLVSDECWALIKKIRKIPKIPIMVNAEHRQNHYNSFGNRYEKRSPMFEDFFLKSSRPGYNYFLNFDNSEESTWKDYRCKPQFMKMLKAADDEGKVKICDDLPEVMNNVSPTSKLKDANISNGCTDGKSTVENGYSITESIMEVETIKNSKTAATTSEQESSCDIISDECCALKSKSTKIPEIPIMVNAEHSQNHQNSSDNQNEKEIVMLENICVTNSAHRYYDAELFEAFAIKFLPILPNHFTKSIQHDTAVYSDSAFDPKKSEPKIRNVERITLAYMSPVNNQDTRRRKKSITTIIKKARKGKSSKIGDIDVQIISTSRRAQDNMFQFIFKRTFNNMKEAKGPSKRCRNTLEACMRPVNNKDTCHRKKSINKIMKKARKGKSSNIGDIEIQCINTCGSAQNKKFQFIFKRVLNNMKEAKGPSKRCRLNA